MQLQFSIGIPAFKAKFLKESIQSILSQTFKNFELIIVNDDSPEDIESIVRSFNDDRIVYSKNKANIGAEHVVDNWNKCLGKANGKYFVLMGDDDKMEPDYLYEFSELIKKHPDLDVFHCRSFIIDENSNKTDLTPSWPELESVYDNISHRLKDYRIQFISDFVYKTSTLKKNGGFYKLPLGWMTDDISAYIAAKKNGIAHINKPVFCYRRNHLTISTKGNLKLKMKAVILAQKWFEDFLQNVPKLKPEDLIVYKNIDNLLTRSIRKKKLGIIALSYNDSILINISYWIKNGKKFKLSPLDFLLALAMFVKQKVVK